MNECKVQRGTTPIQSYCTRAVGEYTDGDVAERMMTNVNERSDKECGWFRYYAQCNLSNISGNG